MAVSFFKKSFSAYYGYQNRITESNTLEEDEESSEHSASDNESTKCDNKTTVQKLSKSKSAYEMVNLAKKNLVDKLSECSLNVTKLTTYDHHSLLKSIQKEDESNQEDEEEEFVDSVDQMKEIISFNLYEQGKTFNPNQPFSLINPVALPIDLKHQILQQQIECTPLSDDEDRKSLDECSNKSSLKSSDEDKPICFDKYDEYGFLKTKNIKKVEDKIVENLMKMDSSEEEGTKNEESSKNDESSKTDEKQLIQQNKQEVEDDKEFEKLKNKWLTYLELTYNQVDEPTTKWHMIESKIKHTSQLDNLIESNPIPYFLRSQLWSRFSNAYLMKEKCEFTYAQLCKKSNHIKNLNDRHSLRILPNNLCFQNPLSKVNQSLRRILRVIKWIERNGLDPITNNLETLNLPLITAYLLLIFNEEDTFWLILSILNEWKLIFTDKGLINKPNNNDLIKSLIMKYCTELDDKLRQEEIDINVLINHWFTSLFADVINNTHILFYLWDLYFYYGLIVIVQFTFGLLLNKKDELIKSNNSVDLINTISSLPDDLDTNEKLLQIWRLGKDNLDNLDQEFYTIKNHNELQGELLRIGVPAVKLFNENTSGIKLLPLSCSLNRLSDLNNELKFKNVRQSAILMELHESISAIAQHFQSNNSDFKIDLTVDYNLKEVNKFYKSHKSGLKNKPNEDKKKDKCKRAKALIDFKRIDDDELGFRKNDVIKILDDRDEHCWAGELNDQQGLFPSKFVQLLNENYGNYNELGDDSVHPFINDLIRGRFCAVIKCILNHGLKKTYFFTVHPWMILETLTSKSFKKMF